MLDILAGLFAAVYSAVAQECYALELALTLAAFTWLFLRRRSLPQWIERFSDKVSRLARRPLVAIVTVTCSAVGLRLALLPFHPIPHPFVPDEFSHILLGRTLALGRLTNPTPAMWVHFEAIHEVFRPTYNSMYMPGQGLFLAAGLALFGHPWFGVLLSSSLFSACLYWMLRRWFPARWALAGAFLAVLRFSLDSYWINSYWGGFVPAAGGALLFGAYPRLIRKPGWASGLALGAGIVLLANTRPFEGAVITTFILTAIAWRLFARRRRFTSPALLRAAIPLVIVCAVSAAAMMTYFHAVTGSPFLLPYRVNQQTYGWPMTLPWFSPPAVTLRHVDLRHYFDWELREHENITSLRGFLTSTPLKLSLLWRFFLGPALTLPLFFLPAVWRSRRYRFLLAGAALALGCVLIEQSVYPHYYSPATACIVAIELECLRRLSMYRRDGIPIGGSGVGLVFLVLVTMVAVRATAPYKAFTRDTTPAQLWCCRMDRGADRAQLVRTLEQVPGKHLVLVSFARTRWELPEWIYNDPDIDASRIVWADDMGDAANAELIAYYSDRVIWKVLVDTTPVRLKRYLR